MTNYNDDVRRYTLGLPYHKISNAHVMSMLKMEVETSRVALPWIRRPGPTDETRSLPRYVDAIETHEIPLLLRPTEVWMQSLIRNDPRQHIQEAMTKLRGNNFISCVFMDVCYLIGGHS